ncbi:CobD/CbiB family cobalamin biosynthesis protein, partial [Prauserella alba]
TRRSPLARFAVTTAATWAVLGGTGLAREGDVMAGHLQSGDLSAARARLGHLCGRDATELDGTGLARAATESIAENTSDAVVAPLVWGGIAGLPGLLGYRALNTLDAMVGHRSTRYERFGWAAARADDVANLVPSRLSALAAALAAPGVGGRPGGAVRAWRRDAHRHPSPNAGPVEAAFAGALGVRLGGTNVYGGRAENRGTLGDGPSPSASDLGRSVRLSRLVGLVSLGVTAGVAAARRH